MSTYVNAQIPRTRSSAQTLKLLRQTHLYFGLFISPALLFFAFTGAMQTLSLHEAAGSSYKPPAALAVWAQIHKNQTWMLPARRPAARDDHHEGAVNASGSAAQAAGPAHPNTSPEQRPGSDPGPRVDAPKFSAAPRASAASPSAPQQPVTLSAKQKQHLPLKLFFLVVTLGLFTSTFTGIYMAYRYTRNKLLVTGVLLAGVVVPLVLLPF